MKELDLHGLYHYQVQSEIENFILLHSNECPLRIITGNSTFMKNLTQQTLSAYNFNFYTPSHNAGEIIVTFDNDYKL